MTILAELRLKAVQAESDLRALRLDYEFVRASGEQAIIERAGGEKNLGSNAEARERAFVLGLRENHECERFLGQLLRVEKEASEIQARIKIEEDERRERELAVKERYVRALEARTDLANVDWESRA